MEFLTNKFMSQLSGRLRNFKQTSDRTYNFSCPFCGDSDKNKRKARGYIYGDASSFHCHNCFSGETTILTQERGIVPFHSLVGETINVKTKNGEWRPATIKCYGKQTVYDYTFKTMLNPKSDNIIVRATENHRWFIINPSKKRRNDRPYFVTEHLEIGDILLTPTSTSFKDNTNYQAIIHGLVFGDGVIVRKKYAQLRICKQDAVRDEIIRIVRAAGFRETYPPSFNGDAWVHFGAHPEMKSLPGTNDADYIEGFIYGWWLADGYKKKNKEKTSVQISTANPDAAKWLFDNAPYIGYRPSTTYIAPAGRKGAYSNGKPLHNVTLTKNPVTVIDKVLVGDENVYCLEEPITHSFILGNGLLTGNCSAHYSFRNFLKVMDYGLYAEYVKDTLSTNPHANIKRIKTTEEYREPSLLDELVPLSKLGSNHLAKQYVDGRKIPKEFYSELYYCPQFKKFVNSIVEGKFEDTKKDEARIVIPFYSKEKKLFGFQGRSLQADSKLRYITIMYDDRYPKFFGMDRADLTKTFYILEGSFDSMFLSNALACNGSDMNSTFYNLEVDKANAIVVYDNEPRNREIVGKIRRCIDDGFNVCIWPYDPYLSQKDINGMILEGGYSASEIEALINARTFKGLRANLEFSKWKKV